MKRNHLVLFLLFTGLLGSAFLNFPIVDGFSLYPYRVIALLAFPVLLLFSYQLRFPKALRVVLAFWGFMIAYSAIQLPFVKDPASSMRAIGILFFYGVFFLGLGLFRAETEKRLRAVFWVWAIALMLSEAVGIWNVLTGEYLVDYSFADNLENTIVNIPRSFYKNQNDYAFSLVIALPLLLVFSADARSPLFEVCLGLVGLSGLALLGFTYSRACYLAIGIEVFVALVLWKRYRKRILTMIVLLLIVILLFEKRLAATLASQVVSLISPSATNGSIALRQNLIMNGLSFAANSGFLGIGAGNSAYYLEHYALFSVNGLRSLHNWWVELLTEYGVLGLSAYFAMVFYLIHSLVRRFKRAESVGARSSSCISASLVLSLTGMIVGSISSSSIFALAPHWMLYGTAALYIDNAT